MNPEKQKLTEKILLHLANCIKFGCSYQFKKRLWILDIVPYDWGKIDESFY